MVKKILFVSLIALGLHMQVMSMEQPTETHLPALEKHGLQRLPELKVRLSSLKEEFSSLEEALATFNCIKDVLSNVPIVLANNPDFIAIEQALEASNGTISAGLITQILLHGNNLITTTENLVAGKTNDAPKNQQYRTQLVQFIIKAVPIIAAAWHVYSLMQGGEGIMQILGGNWTGA